jgi:linalool 8-monooxygenase
MQDTPVMATSTATRPDFKNPDLYVQGVPHDLFAQVRATEPVYWNPESDGPGFWAVLRYADIVEVSRQPLLFRLPMPMAGTGFSTRMKWA